VLAEGDGCWVGVGVGEPPGLPWPGWPDRPGLPWPGLPCSGRPDGLPLGVPDADLDGLWWRGEPDQEPWDTRRSGWADPLPDEELAWPAAVPAGETGCAEASGCGASEPDRAAAGASMVL
jgi:hypothetical protein